MQQLFIYYYRSTVWASVLFTLTLTGCNHHPKNNMIPQQKITIEYQEGIDISHHQEDIDWNELTPSNSNKVFIIAKATEDKSYQDPKFIQNYKNICNAGFQPGAYHFLRFGSSSAKDQMNNFIRQIQAAQKLTDQIKLANNERIIALDVEESNGSDYSLVSSVVEESVGYLKEINITPFIYTRQNFWDQHVKTTPDIVKKCPLWIARYRSTPPSSNELPNGWQEWKIWQYSSTGSVPGIQGNVDLNKMQLQNQLQCSS
ncbi:Lysozyme M1 [Cardinium endosymbiont cEper1 of Encarsia pergandiella]|uniref:glycoside hydrolase family 25 protein n=1 Tax=Cardinium endosymbiont of Encarsia pergandiella TaxID=249402 RepID=UPI00027EA4C4|nr:glycoside hydrolase family 25 protein [Cardinium endosymbiont of Encarsia pergandiella]CCM10306.1 Lysozyme M1 [Cardinium endosymbiont cEper1 of Encarsia pergandiella]